MGYTHFTVGLIEPLLHNVNTVIDLGAQNDFRESLPAPYISDWYEKKSKLYVCIDLNGENNAYRWDLSQVLKFDKLNNTDLLVDAGTSEHVGHNGKFSWESIYNCWLNKHNLLKLNGHMVNENPKTGNWPGHGFNYYTEDFYRNLENTGCYKILQLGEHPAMNNTTDGWNIYCVMQKVREDFITLEVFKTLGICTE